jgi:GMP synthase (glutamine-hydrolysing)
MRSAAAGRIVVLQHENLDDTDSGLRHLARQGFTLQLVRPDLGEKLPEPDDDISGVIIGGGPQFVTALDRFPYLRSEMAFAEKLMRRRIPLLGICLGGQLIAHQLGARVGNHPDGCVALGYYRLDVTGEGRGLIPDGMMSLSGNAQGFDRPSDARLLAKGDLFPNQAFAYEEKTVALQFHPEVTSKILDRWKATIGGNAGKPGTQTVAELDAGFARYNETLAAWYRHFLDRFFVSDMH